MVSAQVIQDLKLSMITGLSITTIVFTDCQDNSFAGFSGWASRVVFVLEFLVRIILTQAEGLSSRLTSLIS